jgi:hypothetical protein
MSLSLSKIIPPGVLSKLEMGFYVGAFPFGYEVIPAVEKGKFSSRGTVVINQQEKNILVDLFTIYSQGGYSLYSLQKILKEKYPHWKSHQSNIARFLRNKFYIGIMSYKGQEFPHKYPTFISKETFDRCQDILDNNNRWHMHKSVVQENKQPTSLSPQEQMIVDFLSSPLDFEDLSLQTNIKPLELKSMLTVMIEKNIIKKTEYGEYVRVEC